MKKAIGFLLGCCIAAMTFAQKAEVPLYKENGAFALVANLSTSRAYDNQLWLDVSTGPIVTKALRIYSDPSHTLVAVIVDAAFIQTPEGQKWFASFPKGDAVISFVRLPLAKVTLRVPDVPATDEGIRMRVNGNFFGNQGDILEGAYGFEGPAHTGGGAIYFPKVSAEEFKLYLDAEVSSISTSSVEQPMFCDTIPVHQVCCVQSGCEDQCTLINVHSLWTCCKLDTGGCIGPNCPTQICRNTATKNSPTAGPIQK